MEKSNKIAIFVIPLIALFIIIGTYYLLVYRAPAMCTADYRYMCNYKTGDLKIAPSSCSKGDDVEILKKRGWESCQRFLSEIDKCMSSGGKWIMHGNTNTDQCEVWGGFTTQTPGCECGINKCWDGNKCIDNP